MEKASINYVEQLMLFDRWTEINYLPGKVQYMWFKLMQRNNRLHWAKSFRVGNRALMSELEIASENDLIKHRNKLIESGIIRFFRGKKGEPSRYEMLPFWVDDYGQVRTGGERQGAVGQSEDGPEELETDREPEVECREESGRIDYNAIKEYWNSHCGAMPKIKKVTDTRKNRIRSLLKHNYTKAELKEAMDKAFKSDFLNGGGDSGWKADFDWVIKPANLQKILEGNYDNRKKPAQSQKSTRTDDQREVDAYMSAVSQGLVNSLGEWNQKKEEYLNMEADLEQERNHEDVYQSQADVIVDAEYVIGGDGFDSDPLGGNS